MRRLLFILMFAGCFFMSGSAQNKDKMTVLRHVVLFKFKDNTTPKQISNIEDAFKALPAKISLRKGFEWGTNNSPEKLNQGLTHCFFVSFSSEKDRDAYLVNPAHKAFTEIAGPQIDKVTVIDYWVK